MIEVNGKRVFWLLVFLCLFFILSIYATFSFLSTSTIETIVTNSSHSNTGSQAIYKQIQMKHKREIKFRQKNKEKDPDKGKDSDKGKDADKNKALDRSKNQEKYKDQEQNNEKESKNDKQGNVVRLKMKFDPSMIELLLHILDNHS